MVALLAGWSVRQAVSPQVVVSSQPLLGFTLPDVSGQPHDVAEWQDKLRVVNFWGTWCPPCLQELPLLVELQRQYQAQDVQFIGVAIDDAAAVSAFVQKTPVNYPLLIAGDAGMALSQQWGNSSSAVPFTVVLSPSGEVLLQHVGELSREDLLAVIKPFIAAK
jgi:thiol-disulfide isomerase/thioredoxin